MAGREKEYYVPIANVSKIMKKALPGNAKISKEAKLTVQECVSEFISFVTEEASRECEKEKRKIINAQDVVSAIHTLGFQHYISHLNLYLHNYRSHHAN